MLRSKLFLVAAAVVLLVGRSAQADTLTPYEQLVLSTTNGTSTGPVIYYPGNEASGTTAYDYSSGSPVASGTYTNSPTLNQSISTFCTGVSATVNSAQLGNFHQVQFGEFKRRGFGVSGPANCPMVVGQAIHPPNVVLSTRPKAAAQQPALQLASPLSTDGAQRRSISVVLSWGRQRPVPL